jgi:hypothetical protein
VSQTISFTVMPRGITLEGERLPVSVLVSPRLFGAKRLGKYPDWLKWTERLKEEGLRLTLLCEGKTLTLDIDREPLQPELWAILFNQRTLVRPFSFDDYSDQPIFSYSVRLALSTLKNVYQVAGVALGLPDRDIREQEKGYPYRYMLTQLVRGLEVNWDERLGEEWRQEQRGTHSGAGLAGASFNALHFPPTYLSDDGLLKPEAMPQPGSDAAHDLHHAVVKPYAVYHHMPQPKSSTSLAEEPPDMDEVLDFHQALSSLNNYPPLQRALGLVFDLELPREFVAQTSGISPKALSIVEVQPGWEWRDETETPSLATAYFHTQIDAEHRLFLTAPRSVVNETPVEVLGLLNLDPTRFGLAQVDVDGGMQKAIMLAETLTGDPQLQPLAPAHPEVFDPTATLASLRSGGYSLFADASAVKLLERFKASKTFNDALEQQDPQPRPFYAEDLVRGYRLDVWDSHTRRWHSLHRRHGTYHFGEDGEDETFKTEDEEGFVQLAITRAAPDKEGPPPPDDLYLHESIARWAGWSLSAPMPGKHLARSGDPDKAVPPDAPDDPDFDPENPPATPFKMTTSFRAAAGSLPSLRFGRRYRLRARVVDLAGNSLGLDEPLSGLLSLFMALPRDAEGFPYLRYEPVIAPLVVIRDERALTGPGSAVDHLVIRTFNSDPSLDAAAADLTAADRHILPPRASVEMGERLGMFDDESGVLISSPAMYNLISQRDAGELHKPATPIVVGGQTMDDVPLEPGASIDELPYLPDALSRGAALRDLPGTPEGSLGQVAPGAGGEMPVPYTPLNDANPRPGSATLISFDGAGGWQALKPFRLALADGDGPPTWNPAARVLTVHLAKGTTSVIPLSSYMSAGDLKLMGVWAWLREYVEYVTANAPQQQSFFPGVDVDRIAHILQRAVEGGHWMLTPPRLLTLVHAVQQPIGTPQFTRLTVQRQMEEKVGPPPLQTEPEAEPTESSELDILTAWRRPDSPEAYLLGALRVHGASTAKLDIQAAWEDPVDDPDSDGPGSVQQVARADEIPLERLQEDYLYADQHYGRAVGYYDPGHDLIAFVRDGDRLGSLAEGTPINRDAAPRHHFNDTKHHRVTYTAVATSRYREYFDQNQGLDFTRTSAPVVVDVPASAGAGAPRVVYVIPTFGWQRQSQTNVKRSVRFGGGLRVYLERPWYSSGVDELLGVTLWSYASGWPYGADGDAKREAWKPFVTQWGADPIWQTADLSLVPTRGNFPDAVASESSLRLEERTPDAPDGMPGRVDVVGFPVFFDTERKLWYCDLTINTSSASYTPFLRLALARYQPYALPDAKLSRVVLADYMQITPDRSLVVSADPYHPRRLRVTLSGPAPRGPAPTPGTPLPTQPVNAPTQVVVSVQRRNPAFQGDMAWEDAPPASAAVAVRDAGPVSDKPDLYLWSGSVTFAQPPKSGEYRLLIREYEYISANYTLPEGRYTRRQPGRLIYAETVDIDTALIGQPPQPVIGTGDEGGTP